ncbi:hypothetical protein ARMSODRAFT_459969 [Armillaria solidipes]|uniref:Uncharacterized protein n=1 Tax=Armillaria solidipes TaxID=1076256 RepID=A0A2H3B1C0_9AGAR|nr:hypothetical protein ARMSODRAFT_459969 [Armillaria solidipes]
MRLPPPTIVVAIDAGISKPENAIILSQLLQHTKEGGITICCCNFSNHIEVVFFCLGGLPWYPGSYFRTIVQLNRAAAGVSPEGLPESYGLKALLLLNGILSRIPLLFFQLRRCARRRKIVGSKGVLTACAVYCQPNRCLWALRKWLGYRS